MTPDAGWEYAKTHSRRDAFAIADAYDAGRAESEAKVAARLDWAERDVLRGTQSPAEWGVPRQYADGFIAGVHALRAVLTEGGEL